MTALPCNVRNGIKVCSFFNAEDGKYRIEAYRGTRDVGELTLEVRDYKNKPALRVTSIETMPNTRRLGAGTAMYEEALAIACARGALLMSDFIRSAFAESFWRKQKKKGRAKCVKPNPNAAFSENYYRGPLLVIQEAIEEDCYARFKDDKNQSKCVQTLMKNAQMGLPKPRRRKTVVSGDRSDPYWPCGIYAMRKTHCQDGSLKGLRR